MLALVSLLVFCFVAAPARAFPGIFAGKGSARRISNATQVVLLQKGDRTVVELGYVWPSADALLVRTRELEAQRG